MRNLLYSLIVLSASLGRAAPVLSGPVTPCTQLGAGPRSNVTISFAVWTAPGFACENQDKIFSNFVVTGGLSNDTALQLQEESIGPVDFHVVTFSGNFLTAFGISYDIAVDPLLGPNSHIVRVSGDLSNPTNLPNPITTKSVSTEGGVLLGNIISATLNPGTPLITDATALHILDLYAPNGGAAVSISNTFAQATVPEPASFLLAGAALLLFSNRIRRYTR
jgi:hypothetical protein